MHIEFIDLFRCPRAHEETWLVAALNRMDGRIVVHGKLGCPVCGAEYPIADGVAVFGESANSISQPRPARDAAPTSRIGEPPADEDVIRLAAMLGLSRPGMLVVLAGRMARMGQQLATLTSGRVLALNPTAAADVDSETMGSIKADNTIPVASRSVDGVALDAAASNSALLEEVSRVLKPGGRLAAPASLALPPSLRELVRDERHVVAESIGELISLGR